jgi:carbon catabolite-derepressing protein kinase
MHRDLKPENVLLEKDYRVRVVDFGLAAQFDGLQYYDICGSPGYIAPEILQDMAYDGATVDVFSIGALLYLMVCGKEPFGARTL